MASIFRIIAAAIRRMLRVQRKRVTAQREQLHAPVVVTFRRKDEQEGDSLAATTDLVHAASAVEQDGSALDAADIVVRHESESVDDARRTPELAERLPPIAEVPERFATEVAARHIVEPREQEPVTAEAEARDRIDEAKKNAGMVEDPHLVDQPKQSSVAADEEAQVSRVHIALRAEQAPVAAEATWREQAEEAAKTAAEAKAEAARAVVDSKMRVQAEIAARIAPEPDADRAVEQAEISRAAAQAAVEAQVEESARIAAKPGVRNLDEKEEQVHIATDEALRPVAEAAYPRADEPHELAHPAIEEAPRTQAGDMEQSTERDAVSLDNVQERPPAAELGTKPTDADKASDGAARGDGVNPRRSGQQGRNPRYRPPIGGPAAAKSGPIPSRTSSKRREAVASGRHSLQVELRLLFERGGNCGVTLLPRRTTDLPEALTIIATARTIDLVALDENWYQDIAPNDLGALLRDGFVWRDQDSEQQWTLSGRDVYVLAHGNVHRGFVSCPRVTLGREHAILCVKARLEETKAVLRQAGCDGFAQLDEKDGVPRGWIVLRNVVPRNPVDLVESSDILNVLRPIPQIEIALEGGICLGYSSWLTPHPPSIRIYGDPNHISSVLIDGQEATASNNGCYSVPGWDSIGTHLVWCNSSSKTYSLVSCEPTTHLPEASSLRAIGGLNGDRIAICGPLVRAFVTIGEDADNVELREVLQLPQANSVLIGSFPGEILATYPRHDVRGARCIVASPFAPVWALPAHPLQCDKKDNRILLVGQPMSPRNHLSAKQVLASRPSIERWCRLILEAARKGLSVEPATPTNVALWGRYRQYARDLARRWR